MNGKSGATGGFSAIAVLLIVLAAVLVIGGGVLVAWMQDSDFLISQAPPINNEGSVKNQFVDCGMVSEKLFGGGDSGLSVMDPSAFSASSQVSLGCYADLLKNCTPGKIQFGTGEEQSERLIARDGDMCALSFTMVSMSETCSFPIATPGAFFDSFESDSKFASFSDDLKKVTRATSFEASFLLGAVLQASFNSPSDVASTDLNFSFFGNDVSCREI